MRRLLCALGLLAALLAAPLATGCDAGDSTELGCKKRSDCPRPDRQTCDVPSGICIGFTSELGDTDGGDDPPDAGPVDAGT
jgi:hypothetical protein